MARDSKQPQVFPFNRSVTELRVLDKSLAFWQARALEGLGSDLPSLEPSLYLTPNFFALYPGNRSAGVSFLCC